MIYFDPLILVKGVDAIDTVINIIIQLQDNSFRDYLLYRNDYNAPTSSYNALQDA